MYQLRNRTPGLWRHQVVGRFVCVVVQSLTMHGVLLMAGEGDDAPEGILLIEVHEQNSHKTAHALAVPQGLS